MTIWTPLAKFPGYEQSDDSPARVRSVNRRLRVVFRSPRVLGDSTPTQIVTHPHTDERDSSGSVIPPDRNIGTTMVNVMDFGAVGDGVHDDTAAFAAAFAALPVPAGGTVYAPENDYLINGLQSIKPKSHTRLLSDPNTLYLVAPNSSISSACILAEDITDFEIDGGNVIGERYDHGGTTGEAGIGVRVVGSIRGTVKNISAASCWGDGFYCGGTHTNRNQSSDVVFSRIYADDNRRNGMSITNAHDIRVVDSDLLNTHGTSPQCGLDIEPNKETATGGTAKDIWIENVNMRGNAVNGFHIQVRSQRVTFKACHIEDNASAGATVNTCDGLTLDGNTVKGNGNTGLALGSKSTYVAVLNNIFGQNAGRAARTTPIVAAGIVPNTQTDLSITTTSRTIGTNRYE